MAGIQSIGTKLILVKAGDETENTPVGHITSVGPLGGTAEDIDVTDHDSPGGNKEFMSGAIDFDTVSFSANDTNDGLVEKLFAIFTAKQPRSWIITATDGKQFTFDGAINAFTPMEERSTDGLNTYAGTIKVSGTPTIVPADGGE
jgi:predicted secreted protein